MSGLKDNGKRLIRDGITNSNNMKKYIAIVLLLAPTIVWAQGFDSDLYYGLQGDNKVTELQEFLADKGFYNGPITGNFFSLTLAGVKRFQTEYSITTIAGYFGSKSRMKANELLAQEGVSSTTIATDRGTTSS